METVNDGTIFDYINQLTNYSAKVVIKELFFNQFLSQIVRMLTFNFNKIPHPQIKRC